MVEPFRRGGDHVRVPADADGEPLMAGFGHGSETVHRLLGHHADIDWLRPVRVRHGLETRQPEQVVDEAAHPLAFLVDARERALIPFAVARLRQGERGLRLDHGERRAEFVRRIGGEVHLSPAGLLDRRGHPSTDGQCAHEDHQQQRWSDQEFGLDQVATRLVHAVHRLADDGPVV